MWQRLGTAIIAATVLTITLSTAIWAPPARAQGTYSRMIGGLLVGVDGKYLGVVDASPYNPDSICNTYGDYGSQYSPTSIRNPYSDYGSAYSSKSAYSQYASTPPQIQTDDYTWYITKNRTLNYSSVDPDALLAALGCP